MLLLGSVQAASDPWIRVRSANFELFTTAGERSGREIAGYFEQVHSFFQQAFGFGGGLRPVRIVAFRSAKEFQRYEANKIADAFFRPGTDHDYIVMKTGVAENDQVAVHEYTHLFIRRAKADVPVWLDEGLAELYSNLERRGPQVIVGMPIPGRVQQLSRDKWIDLRTLVLARRDSSLFRDKTKAEMFYAESWALVHMLSLESWYSQRLKALLEGLDRRDSVSAIEKAYDKPIEHVDRELRTYLQGSMAAAVFDVKAEVQKEPEIETGASLPAKLALAELIADEPGKTSDARAAYEAVAREYSDRCEAEQGMAEFLARERRDRDAADHFLRAAQLGCQDSQMWIEYARVLNNTNRPDEALRALREAVRLGPASDAAHFELAIMLVRAGNYRDGLTQFHLVKKLPPIEAPRYYYNLAFAHFRLGEMAQAKALIEKARPVTRNPDEIARLNRLADSLKQAGN